MVSCSCSERRSKRGTPIFISGANVTERQGWERDRVAAHVRYQREVLRRLRALPLFHVAVVNGVALGWGTEYMITCDYRIATKEATFGLPETGLGILPGAGGSSELSALIGLQKTAQSTQALNFVGSTAVVDGSSTNLANGKAVWALGVSKPSTVTVTISNAAGQAVYTGNFAMNAGDHQAFAWDGRGNDGAQWPDGTYTLTATAKDASGQTTAISTEIQGVVDSADLSQDPPVLSIGGQQFTIDKVKKVVGRTSS